MLTAERLRERLSFDAETGLFFWITGRRPGKLAGTINGEGYRQIEIDGRIYLAHRLVWFLRNGQWPTLQLDHIDGDRANNRLSNLRECSAAQNQRNRGVSRRSSTGYKGVYISKKRWRARIVIDGKKHELGSFATPAEASSAYALAATALHGEFAFGTRTA